MVETRLDWTALFVNASCWNLTKPLLQENQATLTETNPEDRTPVAGRHLRCIFGIHQSSQVKLQKLFLGMLILSQRILNATKKQPYAP